MELVSTLTRLVFDVGLTLGVGSSTFALTFYFLSQTDGVVDPSERRFMHAVYAILRIGMIAIALGLIMSLFSPDLAGIGKGETVRYGLFWALLAVITINAILMSKHLMPMRYGPVIAGGSWYALFLVNSLPVLATSRNSAETVLFGSGARLRKLLLI